MNKIVSALALSLIITGSQFAAHSDCFRPYRAEISNKSGGLAKVIKSTGFAGIPRGTEMDNNTSFTFMVKKRGADLQIMAGPEGAKTRRNIEFFCKEPNSFTAQIMLNPKGITTNGFYTDNKPFDVKIINESGGILIVLDSYGVGSIEKTLADGKSIMVTAQPGGYIVVQSGPENKKVQHRINFVEQTTDNPSITFIKRGILNRGIQYKGLEVQTKRLDSFHGIRRIPTRVSAAEMALAQRTQMNSDVTTKKANRINTTKQMKRERIRNRRGAAPAA